MAELKFMPILKDTAVVTSVLTDAELGELVRWMMLYYFDGNDRSMELSDRVQVLCPLMAARLDESKGNAERIADARSKASKGNKAEQTPTNDNNCSQENPTKPNKCQQKGTIVDRETEQTPTKGINCTHEEEEEEVDIIEEDNSFVEEHSSSTSGVVPPPTPSTGDGIIRYAVDNLQSLSPRAMEELDSYKDELPDEVIKYAIDMAVDNGKPVYRYTKAILDRYIREGLTTLGAVKAADIKRQGQAAAAPRGAPKPNQALEYEQREYTDDYFDKMFVDPTTIKFGKDR